jgi:hypothetical protein
VKSNTQEGVPFFLLIRDPSKHIHSIQENKKFADNLEDSIAQEPPSRRPDYKFTVSVPKADNYFPVMRYKCGNELRPVPIVSRLGLMLLPYNCCSANPFLFFSASTNKSTARRSILESSSSNQL